ncbi:MAG: FGGY family carbohydrate kinase [Acetobacter papayae]
MRVAALDQGTTSTRCLVFEDGADWQLVGSIQHAQHYPHAGHVEHDGEELLANLRTLLAQADRIDAIGIANQGESCLAWDALTGAPLSPVIVWQDARTAESLASLPPDAAARSRALCGLPLDPYFSASKLGWVLRNIPAARTALAEGRLRLGTTDAFFLDRLCGVFATDAATASRTGLLDLQTGQWSPELCALHGVPPECLPEIRSVNGGFGSIGGVPVTTSIVDQQAALYGHGCRAPGDTKITFGTGAFLLTLAGENRPPESDLLPTVAWRLHDAAPTYALEGGVYDAGAALEWARSLRLFDIMEELSDFEGPSALSRGLVCVPALSGLAAPFWDRTAAPLFIGMSHGTTRQDMVRALLEGIAMLTSGLIAAAPTGASITCDGGLSQSWYFAQFLASASGRTIIVPAMHEVTALGLAELCGVDVSFIRSQTRVFHPDGTVSEADHQLFRKAVERARHWFTPPEGTTTHD